MEWKVVVMVCVLGATETELNELAGEGDRRVAVLSVERVEVDTEDVAAELR